MLRATVSMKFVLTMGVVFTPVSMSWKSEASYDDDVCRTLAGDANTRGRGWEGGGIESKSHNKVSTRFWQKCVLTLRAAGHSKAIIPYRNTGWCLLDCIRPIITISRRGARMPPQTAGKRRHYSRSGREERCAHGWKKRLHAALLYIKNHSA